MPQIEVELPVLHEDQITAYNLPGDRFAIRCGRRWGKTTFGKTLAADSAIKAESVGWFAPNYKYLSEPYNELSELLEPVKLRSSKTEGIIRTINNGQIDFWTLDDDRAGRGRKYHKIFIDEGAFTGPNMLEIWEQAIQPTLLDYSGVAYVMSNTNGNDPTNFLYAICNDPKYGFTQYHAPTMSNPLVPMRRPGESEEIYQERRQAVFDKLKADNHPLVFAQEYLAEFVDWSGVAFLSQDKLLINGQPVPYPPFCDAVFAIIDSATKTGKANDGTAVTYFAVNKVNPYNPLIILDWDILQIEGDLLISWLPSVLHNLEALAGKCGARNGSLGALVEDKDSGQILLQQATRLSLKAQALPSGLTAIGKDERALGASSHHYQEKIKISDVAFNKVTSYKGTTRNHLLSQITGFRIGDKDAAKRADDLLDTYTYGVAVALGSGDGF